MELWACGFNAWNQLRFSGENANLPRDLYEFTCVLKDDSIELLRTSLSATLAYYSLTGHGNSSHLSRAIHVTKTSSKIGRRSEVRTSSGFCVAGSPDDLIQLCYEKMDGLLYTAIAGNGSVAEARQGAIKQFDSLEQYLGGGGNELGHFEDSKQVTASQTSFASLLSNGTVLTWGDVRYSASLGREASEKKWARSICLCDTAKLTIGSPASIPCIVEDLLDLPTGLIKKVSSGGYMSAALTHGNDLYCWGGRPGQASVLEELSDSPKSIDIEGQDVLDVAVGDNHLIALTIDRKVFIVGAGRNGQLGMQIEELREWREITLPLAEGQQVTSVHAGYKNSFVLVEDIMTSQI